MAKKTKISPKLIKYLDSVGIKHDILEHRTVYTAIDAAATLRKKINEIAKSLLVKADRDYYIVILPADHNLDFKKLSKLITKETGKKIKTIKIPAEKIMNKALKLKSGTLSAFGSIHNLPVIMEKKLEKIKKAIFPSGSYNHSVEMAAKDFAQIEQAFLGMFGVKKKLKKPKVTKPKKKAPAKPTTKKKSPAKKKK